ncbi:MAG TPA: DUF1272 domain-containing protein [Verrucomicrobiae bacterium]|nr:DUF1272 domain-containing protein [Verrucomicrobiae bacterium]
MALEMKTACEKCKGVLKNDGEAFICSYECTFCPSCAKQMNYDCPNCSGELLLRPKRKPAQ